MSSSLIAADQDFALWAVLIGLTAFGFWCERYPWGRRYSGVLLLMTAAIVLANIGVLPTVAPVYDQTWELLVPLAIPLLLLKANLPRIIREAGPMLIAFLISGATVVLGVMTGVALLDLGESEAELAGIFTGTYIGGALNFAAVAEATGFRQSGLLTAAIAADNVATNLHYLFVFMLPGVAWFGRKYPSRHIEAAGPVSQAVEHDRHQIANLDVAGLLMALAVAFAIAASGKWLAALADIRQYDILVITVLAVLVGSLLPRQVEKLSGYEEAGTIMMYIFLAAIGATCDIWMLVDMAPVLFVFASIILTVHVVLLLVAGKFLKLDLAEMLMASAVAIGGPSSAPALASARGWNDLLIPGVLLGCLGYVIGSFIGMAVFAWFA